MCAKYNEKAQMGIHHANTKGKTNFSSTGFHDIHETVEFAKFR